MPNCGVVEDKEREREELCAVRRRVVVTHSLWG